MPDVTADFRRWVKDQFSKDEDVSHPKKILKLAHDNLLDMNAAERSRTIDHLNANAVAYYNGRHNEQIPPSIRQAMRELERRADRLNLVDQAKAKLEQYGGPPTQNTIQDSLDRSDKERSMHRTHDTSFTHTRPDGKTHAPDAVAASKAKAKAHEHSAEREA